MNVLYHNSPRKLNKPQAKDNDFKFPKIDPSNVKYRPNNGYSSKASDDYLLHNHQNISNNNNNIFQIEHQKGNNLQSPFFRPRIDSYNNKRSVPHLHNNSNNNKDHR